MAIRYSPSSRCNACGHRLINCTCHNKPLSPEICPNCEEGFIPNGSCVSVEWWDNEFLSLCEACSYAYLFYSDSGLSRRREHLPLVVDFVEEELPSSFWDIPGSSSHE